MDFAKLGLKLPTILLPNNTVDLEKWAVVACDQFTSQPEYWKKVEDFVGEAPSTLKLIFPEIYIDDASDDSQKRIVEINKTMQKYLDDGTLQEHKDCFIAVDRRTSRVPSRKGLVVAIDLEAYDFSKGSKSLIRSTEGTIVNRLPPRIKVREQAAIETPHILVLIDDPQRTVIEPLFEQVREPLYRTDLMFDGGSVKGYKIDDERILVQIAIALEKLADPVAFQKKYSQEDVILFAMGDGNHSLATAKAIWEEEKKKGTSLESPKRYALVELVNVYDEGLEFEPIHRVLFGITLDAFIDWYVAVAQERDLDLEIIDLKKQDVTAFYTKKIENQHRFCLVGQGLCKGVILRDPEAAIEAATIQNVIDELSSDIKVDYIHGEDVVFRLSKDACGILIPGMSKHDLFKTVVRDGLVPRKTFSLGEPTEKRYYVECRKIQ